MSLRSIRSSLVLSLTTGFALLAFLPGQAFALSANFDSSVHGEVISTQVDGISVVADNPNRSFNIAAAFDTRESDTSDPDLEASLLGGDFWSAGNLANVDLGRVLILQENNNGCISGICLDPDDEGRRPAGSLDITLDTAISDFGFDLVDAENATAENAFIDLFDGNRSATVALTEYLDSSSSRFDASIVLGNNSANRFAAITAASVGLSQIDRVVIRLGGSGGVDNLRGTVVPEPTSALLLGLGLATLAHRRKMARAL